MLNECNAGSDLSSEFITSTESLIDAAQQNHSDVKLAHPEWCRTAAKGPIDCRGLKLFFLQHLRGAPMRRRKGKGERMRGRWEGGFCVNYCDVMARYSSRVPLIESEVWRGKIVRQQRKDQPADSLLSFIHLWKLEAMAFHAHLINNDMNNVSHSSHKC